MGTHFDPNCKHFCSDSHFIEFPFYREKIATLYNFFRYPFPEKHAFWSRNPCCLTSFFSKSSHFRESVAICWQNPHFIENPFYREKIAAYFGGISRKIPILSNSHFIENVLYGVTFIWNEVGASMTEILKNPHRSRAIWVRTFAKCANWCMAPVAHRECIRTDRSAS